MARWVQSEARFDFGGIPTGIDHLVNSSTLLLVSAAHLHVLLDEPHLIGAGVLRNRNRDEGLLLPSTPTGLVSSAWATPSLRTMSLEGSRPTRSTPSTMVIGRRGPESPAVGRAPVEQRLHVDHHQRIGAVRDDVFVVDVDAAQRDVDPGQKAARGAPEESWSAQLSAIEHDGWWSMKLDHRNPRPPVSSAQRGRSRGPGPWNQLRTSPQATSEADREACQTSFLRVKVTMANTAARGGGCHRPALAVRRRGSPGPPSRTGLSSSSEVGKRPLGELGPGLDNVRMSPR